MDTSSNRTVSTQSKVLPFYKTIRFKLTLLYSAILFLFSGALVFTFNVYLNQYLRKEPSEQPRDTIIFFIPQQPFATDFQSLKIEERKRILDFRLQDLKRIQLLSIKLLIPLAVGSFALGYYVSGSFLSPLNRLKNEVEKVESKNLGKTLKPEMDDEIGELVNSFNQMSSRLETAFKTQEQFVQNASHELRTPLTIIHTNLDTILDDKTASKEEMQHAITEALGGVRQLRKLVNYLLELTSISPKQFAQVDVVNVVNSQINALSELAKSNGVTFKHIEPKVTLPNVLGDEALLGRVMFNLLENACKYTTVATDPITISYTNTSEQLLVSVTNTGVEIPVEKQEQLFERFYQLDPSRNKKLGGYGLGLAIARKIAEEHGGTITIKSLGKENTFTVVLPIMNVSTES